ncbi:hypothetical protein DFS34DRAFT_627056 [Phlyctochytrium arcticum]|nr:hypothetical protein DFS34DRAFT_627056 [Phlyctochytrium arcticum]
MGVYTPTKQVPLGAKLQKFEVRSNKDPLITASRLSMGTYNMGEDKTTVLTLGIALVTLGAIVAVSTMSTVAMCIRLATRQRLRRPGGPPAPNTDGKLEGSTSRGVSLTPGRPPGVVGSQTLATSPSGNLSTSVAQPVSNRGHGYSPSMKSLNISLPAPLASETDAFHTTSSKLYPSAKDHLEPFQASRNKGSTKSLLPPYESNKDLLDP